MSKYAVGKLAGNVFKDVKIVKAENEKDASKSYDKKNGCRFEGICIGRIADDELIMNKIAVEFQYGLVIGDKWK